MLYIKRAFWTVFWVLLLAFLHYTLPQRDIVRIVETEVRRVDFGENSLFWAGADSGQDTTGVNRDVRFVNTVHRTTYLLGLIQTGRERPMVYRNEDTGWGWPPYFKLDSSNLQTELADNKSTADDPQWVVLTHYGWRNEVFSIFPNAVGVRPIENPNTTLIPWFNALILIILAGLMLGVFRLSQWFKREKIDPVITGAQEGWDDLDAYADRKRAGFRGWLDSFKSKDKRY
ncbi:MAG: DUF1523 family protein [Pseudomonadota bacterium]